MCVRVAFFDIYLSRNVCAFFSCRSFLLLLLLLIAPHNTTLIVV